MKSSIAYTIGGFIAGEIARVTLGFAERKFASCQTGKRVFNVTVNGQPFATNLDVYGRNGCYQALVIVKTYAANRNGEFVINLTVVKGNPMVSLVAIDAMVAIHSSDYPSTMYSQVKLSAAAALAWW